MEKYIINENRSELTNEQLEKGMDFSRVKKMAAGKTADSFYKAMIAAIGVTFLIVSPAVFYNKTSQQVSVNDTSYSTNIFVNTEKDTKLPLEAEASIKPSVRPFPNIPVEYEKFTINANERSIIKSKDGSIIVIPANSLIDSIGNSIKGKVDLRYQEYRDMVDVFLSGIPMDYDSAGIKKHFESAGMFELLAYQNNKALSIEPGKTITIEFASQYKGDRFNFYYFNQQTQRWDYQYKDTSKTNNQNLTKQIGIVTKEINMLKKNAPLKPLLVNSKQVTIKLDVLDTEFPEIAVYSNVRFQIINHQKINLELDTLEWDMVKIKRTERGNYMLHFERGNEVKEFSCVPVFEKADYANAKKIFEEKYNESLNLIKGKEKIMQDLVKKYNAEKASQKNSLIVSRTVKIFGSIVISSQDIITRVFSINKFGIFNSDCPKNLPQGSLFALKLVDRDSRKKAISFNTLYLVEKNKNALYTYYNVNKFSYNPQSKNTLWTVTSDNKLAVFSNEDFRAIKSIGKGEELIVDMKIINVNFKNEAQIRKYLEI
jgi:hypothetical protein